MKKIQLLLIFLSLSTSSFSQDLAQNPATEVDGRIVEVFGDQLQTLVLSDPQRLKDLNAILFERHEIIEYRRESDEKFTKLSSVPLFNKYNPNLQRDTEVNPANFNVLKYNLQFFVVRSKMEYRIDNTDLLLVIHPQNPR